MISLYDIPAYQSVKPLRVFINKTFYQLFNLLNSLVYFNFYEKAAGIVEQVQSGEINVMKV